MPLWHQFYSLVKIQYFFLEAFSFSSLHIFFSGGCFEMFALFGWQRVRVWVDVKTHGLMLGDPHEYPNIKALPHPDEQISVS